MLERISADLTGIDWVICGGERTRRGVTPRYMHPDWERDLQHQCRAAGVAFFMKQMTSGAPIPDDLLTREFPSPIVVQTLRREEVMEQDGLTAEQILTARE
jgi:hypothetical protein